MFESVRARLTLWYVSVLALVLVAFSVGVYALLSRALHARADDGLRSVADITTKSLTNDIKEGQSVRGSAESTVAELFNPQQARAIFDGAGRLLAANTSGEDFHARLPAPDLIPDDEFFLYTVPEEENDADDYHRVAARAGLGREHSLRHPRQLAARSHRGRTRTAPDDPLRTRRLRPARHNLSGQAPRRRPQVTPPPALPAFTARLPATC